MIETRIETEDGPARLHPLDAETVGRPDPVQARGTAEPGAEAMMEVLVRGLAGIVGTASHVPRRVAIRFGSASVEVEWPEEVAEPSIAVDPAPAEVADVGVHQVRAPLVGTFYRAPEPGARPFVEVGDTVAVGQQIGIVEAMKLMNPIVADQAGRVTGMLVEDASPVEYRQPLLALEPVAA